MRSTKFAALSAAAILAVMSLSVASCNTVAGAGQDVEDAGEAVSGAAREVQSDMTDNTCHDANGAVIPCQ